MHHKVLEVIIDHIEAILNQPAKDMLANYKKNRNHIKFVRMKKLLDVKVYIQYIIHQKQYIHIEECNKYVENLLVLTKNRSKHNIIFMSSDPFRIVTSMQLGFSTIPIVPFESFYRDDF